MSRRRRHEGFTLVELLVVLVLLALAAALAGPALRAPPPPGESALSGLLSDTRRLAVRRGEVLRLEVEPSGAWSVAGASQGAGGAMATGRIGEPPGSPLTLVFSPLATCGPGPGAADLLRFDPLVCRIAEAAP